MPVLESAVTLSAQLRALFSPEVICAELNGSGNTEWLLPAEAACLKRAVSSRREEFAAGRACARRALREFGVVEFPLTVAADRRPVWPEGFVGSITHTEGYCAAVVARASSVRAVGIDTERCGRVKPELWPRICGPETEWLQTLSAERRPVAATLIFAAKEAFYKCQYALTQEYLGFDDAHVEISGMDGESGEFRVRACKPIALSSHTALPLAGRYRFHREFLTAAIALAQ
jgi:4'-phosphopantetheinyl transferase EntD